MTPGYGFWIGAVVAAWWGWRDFHRPYRIHEFRLEVSPRRYWFGAVVYALVWVMLYASAERGAAWFAGAASWPTSGARVAAHAPPPNGAPEHSTTAATVAAALLLLTTLPVLPRVRRPFDLARATAQGLALHPASLDLLLAELRFVAPELPSRHDLPPGSDDLAAAREHLARFELDGMEAAIREHLARFNLDGTEQDRVLGSGYGALLAEAIAIRRHLDRAAREMGWGSGRVARLVAAELQSLDLDSQRVFQRVARLEEVRSALGEAGCGRKGKGGRLAGLLNDDALTLLARHRRLLAKIAVWRFNDPARRSAFLRGCGYRVPDGLGFPFWPVVGAFAAVLLAFILPAVAPHLLPRPSVQPDAAPADVRTWHIVAVLAFAAALSLVFAAWIKPDPDARGGSRPFPFWPVAGGFALVSLALLSPALVPGVLPRRPLPSLPDNPTPRLLVGAFVQATVQGAAILWAIGPKHAALPGISANFAWPSFHTPPWRSWLLFGALSYVCGGALILLVPALFPDLPLHRLGLRGVLAVSLFLFTATAGVAALTDRHLMMQRPTGWPGRAGDAAVLGAMFALTDVAVQHWIGFAPPWMPFFTAFYGTIGAVIGALVPSLAADALRRDTALRRGTRPSEAASTKPPAADRRARPVRAGVPRAAASD